MKIGIDARKIRDFGIGTYIQNLLAHLPALDPENTYVIFHYPGDADLLPTARNLQAVSETAPKYSVREMLTLPVKMATQRLDLFHAPHYTLPPLRPCKGIVTIHDVIHLRFPAYLRHPAAYYYAKSMMWLAAHSAQKILTVSACSKNDIVRYLGVSESKVSVVYNGIEQPAANIATAAELAATCGVQQPYILYLGNFMPHKNLDTLIQAYAILKQRAPLPHRLVLAGKNEKLRGSLDALIQQAGLSAEVILTGCVAPEWMPALYAHADLFVYPSRYEGFGLQTLEAMSYGVPVVIANAAALPEIAGDAAARFEPESAEDLAVAMARVLTDDAYRRTLITRGSARVAQFSWRVMAEQTLAAYRQVLQQ